MPNKSLDSFLFDRTLCMLLNWKIRIDIILGIARGLLYFHQDSSGWDLRLLVSRIRIGWVFSVKSDAFSFGVVLLEVISGIKNTGFHQSEHALSLLGYAWKLWKEGKALDLMDQTIRETCNADEFLRCVNVGLLCVQEYPSDRPTMSNVVFMLGSETASLPTPKQPAYVVRRSLSSATSSTTKPEGWNELTSTIEEGR
nr:g-type lectin s-receptor-like serine/threonine-protein kinase [Quercus suber]